MGKLDAKIGELVADQEMAIFMLQRTKVRKYFAIIAPTLALLGGLDTD
ncbi:MAG: hypothetical protein NTX56_16215 [Proteobacteria bacterium]|nr:hypothetical protein [Pseudomonadota bacterium]